MQIADTRLTELRNHGASSPVARSRFPTIHPQFKLQPSLFAGPIDKMEDACLAFRETDRYRITRNSLTTPTILSSRPHVPQRYHRDDFAHIVHICYRVYYRQTRCKPTEDNDNDNELQWTASFTSRDKYARHENGLRSNILRNGLRELLRETNSKYTPAECEIPRGFLGFGLSRTRFGRFFMRAWSSPGRPLPPLPCFALRDPIVGECPGHCRHDGEGGRGGGDASSARRERFNCVRTVGTRGR